MDEEKNNCLICKAYAKESIELIDDGYFIVETKDKKGHDERYMLCSIEHRRHVFDRDGLSIAVREGLRIFKKSFLVFFGEKASIKNHWHVIICDCILDGETADVLNESRIEIFQKYKKEKQGENSMDKFEQLNEKAKWVRKETLKLHRLAPGTRIASSLSPVEIFVVLYYGKILEYDPKNIFWEQRNRFIISKGHGSVSMYPILADLGFFDVKELEKISTEHSFLGNIPDTGVPGFETINGSVGHGLGIACGVALALKRKGIDKKVFVISGDGELNEGAVWEAVMFASFHKLNNLILIVDDNKLSMLGYQKEILGLDPLKQKFEAFNWKVERVDGHNIKQLYTLLNRLKNDDGNQPTVILADTVKGKGIPELENDVLSHVRVLTEDEISKRLELWR